MRKSKVLGTLYGAAYGDSRGAVTEFCTREEIEKAFPEGCKDYQRSISLITSDIVPGMVTDDFGSSCYVMKAILRHKGRFDREIAVEMALDWSGDEIVFSKYAGQNTKSAMERLKQGIVIDETAKARHFGQKNTNGGAMKAAPVGLLACGNQELARSYTKDLCWPTHYNSAAVSGACAIACAVCETWNASASLDTIIESAVAGARISRIQLEEEGFLSFGPYVDKKIEIAAELGRNAKSEQELFELLNGVIGTGIAVQESIPAVFAILAGTKGDFEKSIFCSVNAGGDTDTIASMTGAVLGGYYGMDVIPLAAVEQIQRENQFLHLKDIVDEFTEFIVRKEGIE